METRAIERGAMMFGDVLALVSGERRYGVPDLTTTAIFEQPIPMGFQPMMAELRVQLELLQLLSGATRSDIYAAYAHDITLLNKYRADFQTFIDSAVYASIIKNESIKVAGRDMTVWEYLEQHMPAMAQVPLINLAAETAAQKEPELLAYLKQEADQAVVRLFRIVCLWLDTLVTREFVGLLKATGADTARYHYFRPLQTQRVLKKKNERTVPVGYDATKPFGQRRQYELHEDALIEITHELERHDHDIVKMQVHSVTDYPDPMPLRIVDFLDDTPEFIRRHLRVVSGVIVREQVLKRTTDVELKEATVVTGTWLDSPAITLAGVYAPAGWSGKDIEKYPIGFFSGQKACPLPSPPPTALKKWMERHRRKIAKWSLAVILSMILIALFLWSPVAAGIVAVLLFAVQAGFWLSDKYDNF